MKKNLILIALVGVLALVYSCGEEDVATPEAEQPELNPELEVINNGDTWTIVGVYMTEYSFPSLDIAPNGGKQVFNLANGMNAGYENQKVSVVIRVSGQTLTRSINVNFEDGSTTRVVLSGGRTYDSLVLGTY